MSSIEGSSAPPTSPVLGSNIAFRAMLTTLPGNMAPSEAAANAAAPKILAPMIDPSVKVAPATIANTVVERWDKMATNQGDLREPMHVEGL